MAEAHYIVRTQVPPESVWAFCETSANWVELIPGYVSHEAVDDRRAAWNVQVDLGPFTKLVHAESTVTEVVPLERVKFTLKGSNATPFNGEGEVRAVTGDDATSIQVDIAMTPQGPLGPVVNAIAAPVLPRIVTAFADALIKKLEQADSEH